jgi:hypothetical protein
MYLVSDVTHCPTDVFDFFEDALAYICWQQNISVRFSATRDIPNTTITEVMNDRKEVIGYIRAGVCINPKYFYR